jgi:solute carrier family 25 oxoglutarate transporter 11
MEAKQPRYSGLADAMKQTVQKEGITALWKGFFPLYARCAPHTMLLFLFSENLTYLYRKHLAVGPGTDY